MSFWKMIIPDGDDFEEAELSVLRLLKIGFGICLVIAFAQAFFILTQTTINARSITENLASSFALVISIVLGMLVFMWSWMAHRINRRAFLSNKKLIERLNNTAHGQLRIYDHVGDHISDFVRVAYDYGKSEAEKTAALSNIENISIMLSTPMYGIEAGHSVTRQCASVYINMLVDTLYDWVSICADNSDNQNLEIGIWPVYAHQETWSVAKPSDSSWYMNKQPEEIENIMRSMIRFCQLVGLCREHGGKNINLKIKIVPENNTRIFHIKRKDKKEFGLLIIFSHFKGLQVRNRKFITTGFSTENHSACNRISNIKESYFSAMEKSNLMVDSVDEHIQASRLDSIRSNPFRFIASYFGLEADWFGSSSIDKLREKVSAYNKREKTNYRWWNIPTDSEVFDVSNQVNKISSLS